uniref:TPR repeat-containing protein n=1 Tax=Cyanothece sp. (strain PCC 7425 / ATCC 29141) TaxID=395961 RepID=B8HW56_CYAP4
MTPDASAPNYQQFIDEIVQATLKGKIRSQEQVLQMLSQTVKVGTGEIFERALSDRLLTTEQQTQTLQDELKLAKATRSLRALQTIQAQWQRLQEQQQGAQIFTTALQSLSQADPGDRLTAFLRLLDPNHPQSLTLSQLKQLAKTLEQQSPPQSEPADLPAEWRAMGRGIKAGLQDWQNLEGSVVSWMYEQGRGQLGFTGVPGQQGPWALWSKQVGSEFPRSLFHTLALGQSLEAWLRTQNQVTLADWVELAVLLTYLQRAFVEWCDRQVYNAQLGAKLSIAGFLVFALLWSELAQGWQAQSSLAESQRQLFTQGCFGLSLQILRTFSQREYFPLYGGIFASFSGQYLRDTLNYLDQPLRQAEGTQAKARILTLLGYSSRAQGQYDRALRFHQHALELAQQFGDRPCEIANFNHLSRLYLAQQNYAAAIDHGQRALMLSRQTGDRVGEANGLANLGFSEVLAAKAEDVNESDTYERAIELLQRGQQLCEQLGDRQSLSLCLSSLGIAQLMLNQAEAAVTALTAGWQAAQFSGDLYLQGLNLAYLAQAQTQLQHWQAAIASGMVGMYLLEQIGADLWRQTAALLTVIWGQLGPIAFTELLQKERATILSLIGVDGYDYLLPLLQTYRESL